MSRAEHLNQHCACESPGARELAAFHSAVPVFVSSAHMQRMTRLIDVIHRVTTSSSFQHAVTSSAPPIARVAQSTAGVFAGFDFHLGDEGPRLIEINTNAGGAMLNAAAEWRHPDCCDHDNPAIRLPAARRELESAFIAMFRSEWQAARGARPLQTIAIVDDQPAQQFLYPEFKLFEGLFQAHGIDAFIADAADLEYADGRLQMNGRAIDLVYNRVTDFYFEQASHAALRQAYVDDAAVITPHPRAHALLADKHNLVRLTDVDFLRAVGVGPADIDVLLAGIPLTRRVEGDADAWWRDRGNWFFKPAAGFGSRGAYRGDKITRRAFADVTGGDYVAQRFAPPGGRVRRISGETWLFKVDLRHFVYRGVTQLVAARLYQGQTTNFRTAGGGFAPVIELRGA